jgi:hypothetical protein
VAYLTADQLRDARALESQERMPDDLLEAFVAEFEALAERYRGVAYEPREATVTLPGACGMSLALPNVLVTEVSAVSTDGTDFTQDDLDAMTVWSEMGILERVDGWPGPVVVTYTHGFASPPPAVLRACREFVRAKALQYTGNQPRNALSYTDDNGFSYRESTADWNAGRPTGLMVVDDALNSLDDYRTPGIA